MKTYKEYINDLIEPVKAGKRLATNIGTSYLSQSLIGVKSAVYYNDPIANVEVNAIGARYFGQMPMVEWDSYQNEVRCMGQAVTVAEYGLPDVDSSNHLINGPEDFHKLKWTTENPLDCDRYALVCKAYDYLSKVTGTPVTSIAGFASHWDQAIAMTGFSNILKMVKKQPEVAREYFERIVDDVEAPLLKAVAKRYPGLSIKIQDAWIRVPNISPKIQDEWVIPYFDRLREKVGEVDLDYGWYWGHGEGFMPDPKAYLLKKLPYMGFLANANTEGIDGNLYRQIAIEQNVPLQILVPFQVMIDRKPEEIIEYLRAQSKYRVGLTNGFSLVCASSSMTKVESIDAADAALKAFSVLPCPEAESDFDKIKVEIPTPRTQSFKDYFKEYVKENPDNFSLHWLKDADIMK